MHKLSTGDDATLKNHKRLAALIFGGDSNAVAYLDAQIAKAPNGDAEEVIVDESQMLYLLASMG